MTIVLAFDGDEAGQRATSEALLNALALSDTETDFLRALCVEGKAYQDCVGLLANVELADELALWTRMGKPSVPAPDWWQEMCEEYRSACLGEIERRSRKVNDSGGGREYIKTFNENNPISAILESHGVRAAPGRMAYCPMHDDSTPSLSISKDDGRAYCFNQSCELWNGGRGVDSYDLDKRLK